MIASVFKHFQVGAVRECESGCLSASKDASGARKGCLHLNALSGLMALAGSHQLSFDLGARVRVW